MTIVTDYQQSGYVLIGSCGNALSAANRALSKARKATPENQRHLYKTFIRHEDGAYVWYWVLRG